MTLEETSLLHICVCDLRALHDAQSVSIRSTERALDQLRHDESSGHIERHSSLVLAELRNLWQTAAQLGSVLEMAIAEAHRLTRVPE